MTPLETCRSLLARVDAASGDAEALAKVYDDTIGPGEQVTDCDETQDVLRDFVRELAASLGVHWSLVVVAQ